eukprot:TRINITY_DN10065_c0_g2_i3.p1 TRINITY_DN10065_c0_g2~~TRINITY_DN10065_c0_g2_i3.p1  ORF type:complete len:360 (+),score=60.82 TRINITY_DN10065_c0_g2_i3:227-1306(+)
MRRRMLFTTNARELIVNSMHCRIPLNNLVRDTWVNLSLDIANYFAHCFKLTPNFAIDSLVLNPYCKIRRIFAMKGPIMDSANEFAPDNVQTLPKTVEYPVGVDFANQLYSPLALSLSNPEESFSGIHKEARQAHTITGVFGECGKLRGEDSVHESMQEGMKRLSRFRDVKKHAHVLKTPDVKGFSNPLVPKTQNGIITKKAARDKSEPPTKPKNDKLLTSCGKSRGNRIHTKQPSKVVTNGSTTMFTTQKHITPIKAAKEPKKHPEINNYCNRGKFTISCKNRLSNRRALEEKKSKEPKNTPSYMLLKTIGASQLNTFAAPATEESSSDEIEEAIEADDRATTIQEENYATPLYLLLQV